MIDTCLTRNNMSYNLQLLDKEEWTRLQKLQNHFSTYICEMGSFTWSHSTWWTHSTRTTRKNNILYLSGWCNKLIGLFLYMSYRSLLLVRQKNHIISKDLKIANAEIYPGIPFSFCFYLFQISWDQHSSRASWPPKSLCCRGFGVKRRSGKGTWLVL